MAEALAIRAALSHAHHHGISKIWLFSDSQELIRAIISISKPKNLNRVISDIKSLSSSFDFFIFYFLSRDQNICILTVWQRSTYQTLYLLGHKSLQNWIFISMLISQIREDISSYLWWLFHYLENENEMERKDVQWKLATTYLSAHLEQISSRTTAPRSMHAMLLG